MKRSEHRSIEKITQWAAVENRLGREREAGVTNPLFKQKMMIFWARWRQWGWREMDKVNGCVEVR